MAVFLPDTSVLVDALNGKRHRSQALRTLVESGHMLASCPVTIAEVFAGMREHEAVMTGRLMSSLRFFETTADVARSAGRLKSRWARRGRTLSLPDVLIAATALHYGLHLITDNEKHFPMPELVLHRLEGPA